MSVILPDTGELLDLEAAATDVLAIAFDGLADNERELRALKSQIGEEITRRLDHEGRRSVTVDGWKIETTAPTEREYEIDELRAVLAELVTEGTISDRKAKACIVFEPKVVWRELKPLTTDPRCQARINHAIKEVPSHRYAKVHRA